MNLLVIISFMVFIISSNVYQVQCERNECENDILSIFDVDSSNFGASSSSSISFSDLYEVDSSNFGASSSSSINFGDLYEDNNILKSTTPAKMMLQLLYSLKNKTVLIQRKLTSNSQGYFARYFVKLYTYIIDEELVNQTINTYENACFAYGNEGIEGLEPDDVRAQRIQKCIGIMKVFCFYHERNRILNITLSILNKQFKHRQNTKHIEIMLFYYDKIKFSNYIKDQASNLLSFYFYVDRYNNDVLDRCFNILSNYAMTPQQFCANEM